MEGEVIIMKWSKRGGIIEEGSQELLYRCGGGSGSGRFALSFHTISTIVGAGVTWLGKYQERGESMPREEGKKDIIIITLTWW
jgi:hypothetical protein